MMVMDKGFEVVWESVECAILVPERQSPLKGPKGDFKEGINKRASSGSNMGPLRLGLRQYRMG